jgi:hypothetical protein
VLRKRNKKSALVPRAVRMAGFAAVVPAMVTGLACSNGPPVHTTFTFQGDASDIVPDGGGVADVAFRRDGVADAAFVPMDAADVKTSDGPEGG